MVAGAGLRAAVPHDVIVTGLAPEKTNVIVRSIGAWGVAPPHQNDVAFLGQARTQQLLLGAESVSTDIAVLNEVFVVGGPRQPVVGQTGAVLIHRRPVHNFHSRLCIQASFPKDVANKSGAVHPCGTAVVARVAVGRLGVAANVGGAQVVVVILVGLQLLDNAFPGNTHTGHVVGAALHVIFHLGERVLGPEDGHVPGAI